ncbi:MAG TPA: FAD binding domain-containing protein [Syntrophorhabdaceae bacterium]|jgi:4-hydroxybenzoyl-CoA reductase subunit beta
MRLPSFDVIEPKTIKEALQIMADPPGTLKVMAGGTELVSLMKLRLVTPQFVLSTRRIGALAGIEEKKKEIVIGAGTTLLEIAESPLIGERFKAAAEAASQVAAYAVQARATVGGNLLQGTRCLFYNQSELPRKGLPACHKAGGNVCSAVPGSKKCLSAYQGDMAPALISLGAMAHLKSIKESRKIPVAELYTGNGKNPLALASGELLTHLSIPLPQGVYGSSYEKIRMRKALDYPLASAAAFVSLKEGGVVDVLRVVIGAAGSAPILLSEESALYKGVHLGEKEIGEISARAFKAARVVENGPLPGAYRRKMVQVAASRALKAALLDCSRKG